MREQGPGGSVGEGQEDSVQAEASAPLPEAGRAGPLRGGKRAAGIEGLLSHTSVKPGRECLGSLTGENRKTTSA